MKPFSAQHRTQTLSGYETTGNPIVVRTQKETGLLFKAEMVIATLEDRKTQTRRLRGLEKLNSDYYDHIAKVECCDGLWCFWEIGGGSSALPVLTIKCPYGGKGDRLWVKETWRPIGPWEGRSETIQYRADESCERKTGWPKSFRIKTSDRRDCWRPSIFMPRWASRITLEIIDVRVERLQEISEQDATAEGVAIDQQHCYVVAGHEKEWAHATARGCFETLWDSINGKRFPWSSSPWVWVIAFKRV